MSIGGRIATGYIIGLLLTVLVSGMGWFGLSQYQNGQKLRDIAEEMVAHFSSARRAEEDLVRRGSVERVAVIRDELDIAREKIRQLGNAAFGRDTVLARLEPLRTALDAYEAALGDMVGAGMTRGQGVAEIDALGSALQQLAINLIRRQDELFAATQARSDEAQALNAHLTSISRRLQELQSSIIAAREAEAQLVRSQNMALAVQARRAFSVLPALARQISEDARDRSFAAEAEAVFGASRSLIESTDWIIRQTASAADTAQIGKTRMAALERAENAFTRAVEIRISGLRARLQRFEQGIDADPAQIVAVASLLDRAQGLISIGDRVRAMIGALGGDGFMDASEVEAQLGWALIGIPLLDAAEQRDHADQSGDLVTVFDTFRRAVLDFVEVAQATQAAQADLRVTADSRAGAITDAVRLIARLDAAVNAELRTARISLSDIDREARSIARTRDVASELARSALEVRVAELGYRSTADQQIVAAFQSTVERIRTLATQAAEASSTDVERRTFAGVVTMAQQFQSAFRNLELFNEQAAAASQSIQAASDEVNHGVTGIVEDINAGLRRSVSIAGWVLALGTLFAVVVGVIVSFVNSALIVGPIRTLTAAMGRLADRELDVDVPCTDRRDEIGQMAKTVQVFKDNAIAFGELQERQRAERTAASRERHESRLALAAGLEETMAGVVSAVETAAETMAQDARVLAGQANTTNTHSLRVAASSEDATSNVETVAAAAEQLASSIGEINRQIAESNRVAQSAAQNAEATNRTVESLAEAARRIGEVVQLINGIAAQTNLLALNATIEAARAGEAGRGFAVVASEVKNLATQTAKATEEIAEQIGDMQNQTSQAVAAIREIGRTIVTIEQTITGVAAAMEQQEAATQEISRNVQKAAEGTQSVSNTITLVAAAAGETGESASRLLQTSEELAQQAVTLSKTVADFTRQIRSQR